MEPASEEMKDARKEYGEYPHPPSPSKDAELEEARAALKVPPIKIFCFPENPYRRK
jgi:hypothetical protein